MADDWWTKKQACEHLQITARAFELYVADGMPVLRISRRVYVKREVIQAEYRGRKLAQKATRGTH